MHFFFLFDVIADFCAGVISLLVYHLIFKPTILPKRLRKKGKDSDSDSD